MFSVCCVRAHKAHFGSIMTSLSGSCFCPPKVSFKHQFNLLLFSSNSSKAKPAINSFHSSEGKQVSAGNKDLHDHLHVFALINAAILVSHFSHVRILYPCSHSCVIIFVLGNKTCTFILPLVSYRIEQKRCCNLISFSSSFFPLNPPEEFII